MTRPATLDEARARLRRLDGGLRLDTERTPPSWTAYGYGVGRGDGETWEAAWDAMVEHLEAVWSVLHDAPAPDPFALDVNDPVLWGQVRALLKEQGVDLEDALRQGTANLQAWRDAGPLPPSDDLGDVAGPEWPEGWLTVPLGALRLRDALAALDDALAQPDRDLDPALYRVERASAAVVSEARRAADEIDALRRQVAELQALGVSLHKAAAAGMAGERAAIVAWIFDQSENLGGIAGAHMRIFAKRIESGEHHR